MEDKSPLRQSKRRYGIHAVGETVAALTQGPLGRRGFCEGSLVTEWPAIVGSLLGTQTLPLRISFPLGERSGGILYVRVASGGLALQLQHLEPLVLQRINSHFGYAAVSRLSIVQGPVSLHAKKASPPQPQLTPKMQQWLDERLSGVDDPDLRAALARLGRHLAPKS